MKEVEKWINQIVSGRGFSRGNQEDFVMFCEMNCFLYNSKPH